MDRSTKELIAAVVAILTVLIAGLAWISDGMNDRFDLIDQRFEITGRATNDRFDLIDQQFEITGRGMNDRFDLIDQQFEITGRADSEAHTRIENGIRELRADFRAIMPRAAAEQKPADPPTP